MIDLKKQSGISLSFDTGAIHFGNAIVSEPVHARSLEDARPYLMDSKATARRKNLYLMYRDVHCEQDEAIFRKYGIRYDITVLFPGTVGGRNGEYIKTIGHTHPAMEIYEVLHGNALFCLQSSGKKENDIFYVSAKRGEKIIIPAGIGHITINIGEDPLILADLFSDTIKSDYSLFKNRHGAAYWVRPPELMENGLTLTRNAKHTDIGDVLIGTPEVFEAIGISSKKPLYTTFIEDPKVFAFLTNKAKEKQIMSKTPLFVINWKGKLG